MKKYQKVKLFFSHSIFSFSVLLFTTYYLLLTPSPALAMGEPVHLYLQASQTAVAVNSEIVVKVLIDSAAPVNAFVVNLNYPKDLLKPVSLNDSGSIVDIWQVKQWEAGDGVIKLSGGMLNPYSGTSGKILEFRLQALKQGVAQISFATADAYLADGVGTKAQVVADPSTVTISNTSPLFYTPQKDDVVAPVFESVQDFKNPADGNYTVAFLVKDSGSGLKAVYLRTMQWFFYGAWRQVFTPTQLPKGIWQYQLAALDNSGNKSIKTSYLWPDIVWRIFLLITLLLVVGILYSIIRKRNPKSKYPNPK